jgi:hypothetical protein
MSLKLYEVLAASGGHVAGGRYAVGTQITLDETAAQYELSLGYLSLVGAAPSPPPPPLVQASDVVETRRGTASHDAPVSALETFLVRTGGPTAGAARRAALIFG